MDRAEASTGPRWTEEGGGRCARAVRRVSRGGGAIAGSGELIAGALQGTGGRAEGTGVLCGPWRVRCAWCRQHSASKVVGPRGGFGYGRGSCPRVRVWQPALLGLRMAGAVALGFREGRDSPGRVPFYRRGHPWGARSGLKRTAAAAHPARCGREVREGPCR